ncbi:MAG TPA: erythromycin esterase family protein [Thermoanaerobaculia bacterium]
MKRLALLVLLVPLALSARTRAVRTGPVDTPRAWLRQHALSQEAFARVVAASADVVALADVTHGTHELYAAKQALVPLLVARGFRVLAFEASYTEYKPLDEYVLHGTGDPAATLNLPPYWFWDTNEILDLVHWARAQNAAGLTPPIRIVGIDATSPRVTGAEVVAYLERVDPAYAVEVATIYHCMRGVYKGTNRCRTAIASVRTAMGAKRDAYVLASSAEEYDEMLHAARVVEQGERVLVNHRYEKDPPMAENVLRYVNRGQKVILFGHNEHWGRTPYLLDLPPHVTSAGQHLASALGDRYFVLGSLISGGTFHAVQYAPGVRSGVIRTHALPAATTLDDYALLFAQAGLPSTIVSLRGPLPPWLAGTRTYRFVGSGVPSLEVPADLGAKFDGVLYVETSTPTQLRHFPTF